MEISFKERARRHQIKFREEVLKVGYDGFETILTDADAQRGLIFFDGFKIKEYAQDRYPHFKLKEACFANMLRSEHIPFNFFVPLSKNLEYARSILNRFMGGVINILTDIKIEYAPDPEKALMDKTSFDVYIEYIHFTDKLGIIGIEVKYTEKEYKLIKGSKEDKEINMENSIYNILTSSTNIYRNDIIDKLKTDEYRQVWRNHLLGLSMLNKNRKDSKFEFFTSLILYPRGNDHFRALIPAYRSFLNKGYDSSFTGITYEEFIETSRSLTTDTEYLRWLQYLEDRYIVTNESL